MTPSLQAKLLRVVQLGEVRPVGADESRRVDVRLIAATHQNLEERLQTGGFRADSLLRLNVVPLHVPPLRDRTEDIALLVEHFLDSSRRRNGHAIVERLAPAVVAALAGYSWPGNVRELENVIERLVVMGTRAELDVADLQEIVPAFSTDHHVRTALRVVERDGPVGHRWRWHHGCARDTSGQFTVATSSARMVAVCAVARSDTASKSALS